MIIVLIIGIIILLLGLFLFLRAGKIRSATLNDTDIEIKKCREQIFQLEQEQREKIAKIQDLEDRINSIQTRIISLQEKEKEIQQQIKETVKEKENYIKEAQQTFKNNSQNALYQYEQILDQSYKNKQTEINDKIDQLKNKLTFYIDKKELAKAELDQLKSVIDAAAAARLTQQEEENKWLFYSLDLTNEQLNDLLEISRFKNRLNDPSLIGKIIWSAFVLKATNSLCNRVLGTDKKCGIYKITNRETQQVYIGQSLSVADRWKAHIKCGLGIDAPATNRLYNNMQQYGVWMFTFELLEECSKDKLNEREKFWIDFYQSDKIGMNSKGGNK